MQANTSRTSDEDPTRATARVDGSLLARIDRAFAAHSAGFVVTAALLLVALIWTVDIVIGPDLSLPLFYLIPMALVTWRLGRGPGFAFAALGASAWLAAEAVGHELATDTLPPYLNAAMRFGVFLIVALLIAYVKESLQWQRDLAAHEVDVAEELREMNELKDTLLRAVSHDLKGPITSILGASQAMQRRETLQLTREQEDGLLRAISASGTKLNRMVSDLLDLERLDRGMIAPECEPTDLRELARRVVSEADFMTEHPVRVIGGSLVISVDAGKVERILENLLSNAAKHTPVGTPVMVRLVDQGEGVTLSVEDEGPGIPDELKQAIFQPFRQGEEAKATGSGAGIGLSLVAKFAELHGGIAWLEDGPDGGTAFRVFLPGTVTHPITPIETPSLIPASYPTDPPAAVGGVSVEELDPGAPASVKTD